MISDLCIDSNSTDEFALTCIRDGYDCIAYNTHKSGALTESDVIHLLEMHTTPHRFPKSSTQYCSQNTQFIGHH